jgi:5-methylcytosine-specific restriction protein A
VSCPRQAGYPIRESPQSFTASRPPSKSPKQDIDSFKEELSDRTLKEIAGRWYAANDDIPGQDTNGDLPANAAGLVEGTTSSITVNRYERNADARRQCIKHHGFKCHGCDQRMDETYGALGENFIHVHHVTPISEIRREYNINPVTDLVPVCPNCHSMIHRTQPPLTIDQLKVQLDQVRQARSKAGPAT